MLLELLTGSPDRLEARDSRPVEVQKEIGNGHLVNVKAPLPSDFGQNLQIQEAIAVPAFGVCFQNMIDKFKRGFEF
jgi:hypothetical protein